MANTVYYQAFKDNIDSIRAFFPADGAKIANQTVIDIKTSYLEANFDHLVKTIYSADWIKEIGGNSFLNGQDLTDSFLIKRQIKTAFGNTDQYNPNSFRGARSIADFVGIASFEQTFFSRAEDNRQYSVLVPQENIAPTDAMHLIRSVGVIDEVLASQRLNIELDQYNFGRAARYFINGGVNWRNGYLNNTIFFNPLDPTNTSSLYDQLINVHTKLRNNRIEVPAEVCLYLSESAYAGIMRKVQIPSNTYGSIQVLTPFISSDRNGVVDTTVQKMMLNGTTIVFKTIPDDLLKLESDFLPEQSNGTSNGTSRLVEGTTQIHALFCYKQDTVNAFVYNSSIKHIPGTIALDTEMDTYKHWFARALFVDVQSAAYGGVIISQPAIFTGGNDSLVLADGVVTGNTVGSTSLSIDLSKISVAAGKTAYTGTVSEQIPIQLVLELNDSMVGYGVLTTNAANLNNILLQLDFDQNGVRVGTLAGAAASIAAGTYAPFNNSFPPLKSGDRITLRVFFYGQQLTPAKVLTVA